MIIYKPSKHKTFNQYWLTVGPVSQTVAPHWLNVSCLLGDTPATNNNTNDSMIIYKMLSELATYNAEEKRSTQSRADTISHTWLHATSGQHFLENSIQQTQDIDRVNPYSAGIDFSRKKLTSVDVRF